MKLLNFFLVLTLLIFSATSYSKPLSGVRLQKPLPRNLWVELNKKTNPSVVGIFIDFSSNRARKHPRYDDPFYKMFEDFFGDDFFAPTESKTKPRPIGTGFLISPDGHIVTNSHVVDIKADVKVQLAGQNGKYYSASILAKDVRGDLALLKIDSKEKLPFLEFGDSDKLAVGEFVAAFGNPYGHLNSITVGIISAKGRMLSEINRFPFLQTDAPINPGNSGGPLISTEGYVIGVNTAIDPRASGIGFTIPSNYVKRIIPILRKGNDIKRGFLGIRMTNITPLFNKRQGLKRKQTGVVVDGIIPGSPAEKGGLKEADLIVTYKGKGITNTSELMIEVQDTEAGENIPVGIIRFSNNQPEEKTLTIAIDNFPGAKKKTKPKKQKLRDLGRKAPFDLGFYLTDSSSGSRRNHKVPLGTPFGPIVTKVEPESKAEAKGMQASQVILEVNGKQIQDSGDVIRFLKKGKNKLRLAKGRSTPINIVIETD